MNKEELYELALSDVPTYSLLNEIFAIRDKRVEIVDYTIGVNGFISLDVLNKYVKIIQENQQLKDRINKAIEYIENCLIGYEEQYEEHTFNYHSVSYDLDNLLEILKGENQ